MQAYIYNRKPLYIINSQAGEVRNKCERNKCQELAVSKKASMKEMEQGRGNE